MDHSGRGQTERKELSVTASFTSGLLSGRGNHRNGAFRETGGAVSRRGTRILFRPRQCEGLLSARAPNPPSAGVLHTSFDTVGGGPSHFRWHPRVTRPDTDSAPVGGGWCAGGRGVWCGGGWLQDPHQPHRRPAASVATRRSLSAVPARAGSDAAPALTPFILRVLLRCRRRRYPRLFFQRPHAPPSCPPPLPRPCARAGASPTTPSPTMGMSLSKVFANLFGKKEMRILMVGLDGTCCALGGLGVVSCLLCF